MKCLKQLMQFTLLALVISLPAYAGMAKGLPSIPGVEGPAFNIVNGKFIVSLKLLNVEITTGGSMLIPKTKESRFELIQNIIDGGTLLQFTIDPKDIKGVRVANDPNTLPDGRPIPGVPGGEMMSLRIDTELFKTSYYFHKTLFAVYIPFNFNTYGLGVSYEYRINNKIGGHLLVVQSDAQGKNAGLMLTVRKTMLNDIEQVLELSKKNPGIVY